MYQIWQAENCGEHLHWNSEWMWRHSSPKSQQTHAGRSWASVESWNPKRRQRERVSSGWDLTRRHVRTHLSTCRSHVVTAWSCRLVWTVMRGTCGTAITTVSSTPAKMAQKKRITGGCSSSTDQLVLENDWLCETGSWADSRTEANQIENNSCTKSKES